jgi:hypothetical protein
MLPKLYWYQNMLRLYLNMLSRLQGLQKDWGRKASSALTFLIRGRKFF